MNRKKLLQAFHSLATADGYTFYSADDDSLSQTIKAYPAMWLSPPVFASKEGRTHGKATYSVTLHALQSCHKLPPSMREQIWQQLEEELLNLFTKLSEQEFVIAVEELTIRHSSQTLSTHAEVAATATADVITFF